MAFKCWAGHQQDDGRAARVPGGFFRQHVRKAVFWHGAQLGLQMQRGPIRVRLLANTCERHHHLNCACSSGGGSSSGTHDRQRRGHVAARWSTESRYNA